MTLIHKIQVTFPPPDLHPMKVTLKFHSKSKDSRKGRAGLGGSRSKGCERTQSFDKMCEGQEGTRQREEMLGDEGRKRRGWGDPK